MPSWWVVLLFNLLDARGDDVSGLAPAAAAPPPPAAAPPPPPAAPPPAAAPAAPPPPAPPATPPAGAGGSPPAESESAVRQSRQALLDKLEATKQELVTVQHTAAEVSQRWNALRAQVAALDSQPQLAGAVRALRSTPSRRETEAAAAPPRGRRARLAARRRKARSAAA